MSVYVRGYLCGKDSSTSSGIASSIHGRGMSHTKLTRQSNIPTTQLHGLHSAELQSENVMGESRKRC